MNGVGQLAGLFNGEILVVGGGIRALHDLKALGNRNFTCVLSANAHAYKIPGLKVDFIVCKDHKHTQTKQEMRRLMAEYPAPVITRNWWGDFRLADWDLQGNSGLMAIAIAAILGGGPIYPIGFDNFQEGTYWHDPQSKNVSHGLDNNHFRGKALKIAAQLFGTQVRPVSGPLLEVFKPFDPSAERHPYQKPVILQKYEVLKGYQVLVKKDFTFPFDTRVVVPKGVELWVSEAEYANFGVQSSVIRLDTELRM